MNKWSLYFKEREGFESLETEDAILSYKITGEECYIRDIFVVPEARRTGAGSEIADKVAEIARASGCTRLLGSVVPDTQGASISMFAMLKYGFQITRSHENFIVLSKEL